MKPPRQLVASLALMVCPLLLPPALSAPKRIHSGTIRYPLKDNIDLRNGTFECWFKLNVDPDTFERTKPSSNCIVGLASFYGEQGGLGMQLLTGGMMGDRVGWYIRPGPKPLMLPATAPVTWKQDEWHHIAVAWKGKETILYLDGKRAGGRSQQASFAEAFGPMEDQLLIGEKWSVGGRFTVDEVRVSFVARPPGELGFHHVPLVPDPYTALLDSFDACDFEPDSKRRTSPDVIMRGEGGLVSRGCRFVEGKAGKAVSLYNPPQD